jgi:hypothetical protein
MVNSVWRKVPSKIKKFKRVTKYFKIINYKGQWCDRYIVKIEGVKNAYSWMEVILENVISTSSLFLGKLYYE